MPDAKRPRVLISYSHDSPTHRENVRLLADQLREWGIDAWLDQYEAAPPKGWAGWMTRQFKNADFILLVCTETYRKRFDDEEEEGKGLGVTWEALHVIRELYVNKGENRRFIPILLDNRDVVHIPELLTDHDRYVLQDEWERLYRRLTGQPALQAPPLGPLRKLPPVASGAKAAEVHDRYLRTVAQLSGHLSMSTIDPKARQPAGHLGLDQIFTTLDTRKPGDWSAESVSGRLRGRKRPPDAADFEKETREPALAAISRMKRLVLLGKPGSGKSTLVKFICLCLANQRLGEEVNLSQLQEMGWTLPALLPVRVILRDYAAQGLREGKPLWEFVRDQLARIAHEGGNPGWFAPALAQKLRGEGGILLLDGLDEVPEAHQRRENLKQAVLDFAAEFPEVRILVTTRPYAYDDPKWQLPGFDRADLLDFSAEQIESYIGRWYEVTGSADPDLGPQQAKVFAGQLQSEVKRNRNLAELAPRPLLLALMVSLHRWRGGGALPQEREKLYDQSVDLLLDLWQRPKQLYDADGKPAGWETSALTEFGIGPKELRTALGEVAFEVHRNQPERTDAADIEAGHLAKALYDRTDRQPNLKIDQIIRYTEARAGLLEDRGLDPRGKRILAFAHRTFQEYLAACHLLDRPTFPDDLAELARRDPRRWREAVLLAASRANTASAVWDLVETPSVSSPRPLRTILWKSPTGVEPGWPERSWWRRNDIWKPPPASVPNSTGCVNGCSRCSPATPSPPPTAPKPAAAWPSSAIQGRKS